MTRKFPVAERIMITVCAGLLLAGACSQDWRVEKQFDVVENIKAGYVNIDELIQVCNIVRLDDYIVLQNGSEAVDDFFFVYSYPEFRFLYSFAKRGRGPNEYLYPSVIKNTSGNVLGLRDHGNDMVAFYRIGDNGAELLDTRLFQSEEKSRFFWEINCIGDSLFLLKHQGDKNGATELWNSASVTMKDSIRNTFWKLPKKLGKHYYTMFDDYQISSNGNRFALAYFMIDRIELGSIENGRILKSVAIGASDVPSFYLYKKNETDEFNVDRNIVYYENLYAGKDFVYALYSNARLDETERKHSSVIEVYDWNGEPVSLLRLEFPVAYFTVDEENRTIYAVNQNIFEDKILEYKY